MVKYQKLHRLPPEAGRSTTARPRLARVVPYVEDLLEETVSVDVVGRVGLAHRLCYFLAKGVPGLLPEEFVDGEGRHVALFRLDDHRGRGFRSVARFFCVHEPLAEILTILLPLYGETRDLVLDRFGFCPGNSEA